MVKGVGFRSLSFRGSWVQIPPPAPLWSNSEGVAPGDVDLFFDVFSCFYFLF
jgi:hypothetical protein